MIGFETKFTHLVDAIQRDGGEVRLTLDQWTRIIHFTPGCLRQLVLDRLVQTIETLASWKELDEQKAEKEKE